LLLTCFSDGTWHSELAVYKSGTDDTSLWDVDFPFDDVFDQASTSKDKAKMKRLGINESLRAMRSYFLWASALANSTEKLCRGQREYYLTILKSWEDKVIPLEERCAKLENWYNNVTRKLDVAESDLKTSREKYPALEKAKSEIQSHLASAQEDGDQLRTRISELASQGVADFDNGF